jgi:hypothetical protein
VPIVKITPRHGPRREHSLSIVEKACLPLRCIATVAVRTIWKTPLFYCCERCFRGKVFTEPLLRNGLHNTIVLLLRACMLRALHSNGRCLQSHRLIRGLYATILSSHLCLRPPSSLFPSGFPTNILLAFLFSPIRAKCPVYVLIIIGPKIHK